MQHFVDDKDRINKNKWRVPGLATALYGHQVIAAGTMIDLERGKLKVTGGILADQEGLGSEYFLLICLSLLLLLKAL